MSGWKRVCRNEADYADFFDTMEREYRPAKVLDCAVRPFPITVDIETVEDEKGNITKVFIDDVKE